mmetsp:Transcript_35516/g.101444  ORF Transcript_35516/g.101444 Transcript_35516/m.101444 type:complete len:221 (+) Transcript_35516:264-926(+)
MVSTAALLGVPCTTRAQQRWRPGLSLHRSSTMQPGSATATRTLSMTGACLRMACRRPWSVLLVAGPSRRPGWCPRAWSAPARASGQRRVAHAFQPATRTALGRKQRSLPRLTLWPQGRWDPGLRRPPGVWTRSRCGRRGWRALGCCPPDRGSTPMPMTFLQRPPWSWMSSTASGARETRSSRSGTQRLLQSCTRMWGPLSPRSAASSVTRWWLQLRWKAR